MVGVSVMVMVVMILVMSGEVLCGWMGIMWFV